MKSIFIFLLKLAISFVGLIAYIVATDTGLNPILKYMLVFALVIFPWTLGKSSEKE